ncbi:MAG TPA: hypothetical protein PKZ76_00940 [Xanthomonadaceae bacterium]|nr:hypothetical protein [Xanthomonadaceae bacterium]
MSVFASRLDIARGWVKQQEFGAAMQSYRFALDAASSDGERLTAMRELLAAKESGASSEGPLRTVAVAVFVFTLIGAIALFATVGTVEVPASMYSTRAHTEVNPWILAWAGASVLSGLVAMMLLLRVAGAMDLLRQMSMRQAVMRLEQRGVEPWTEDSANQPASE